MAESIIERAVPFEQRDGRAEGPARSLAVWCPDWPVVAAIAELGLSEHQPVAVVDAGQVASCNEVARADGVRRGMRRRDSAARCPELVLVDASEPRDIRAYEPILAAVEEVGSAVSPLRPGLCTLPVPSRYYGGEEEAASVLAQRIVECGVWDCRMGIADGMFTAEQAARRAASQDSLVVPTGASRAFLAELSISVLDDPDLVSLLRRLGLHTLGDFAALSARDVSTRFGRQAAWLHRLARGDDSRTAARRRPPQDLSASTMFEPPLETIEPIVFSSRLTAEACIGELARHGLVCTTVVVEVRGERGWESSRTWGHSRWFGATDLLDRLYWQLMAQPSPEPVDQVRFAPEIVESLADHGEGLWGSAQDERVQRGVARLQGMLGPDAVVAPGVQGGHGPRQRQVTSPWGQRAPSRRPSDLPWPGSIPPPAPTIVFAEPRPAEVLSSGRQPIGVSSRGSITGDPGWIRAEPAADWVRIQAWAGPWPIDELWWDPAGARHVARFQIVGVDGSAWLLVVENGQWWTEALYV